MTKNRKKKKSLWQRLTDRFEEIKLYPECRNAIVLLWFYDQDVHLAAERAAALFPAPATHFYLLFHLGPRAGAALRSTRSGERKRKTNNIWLQPFPYLVHTSTFP